MPLPKEIIDNEGENKLANFLKDALRDNRGKDFDVATAFFNLKGFLLLKDELNGVKRFRLLLGKGEQEFVGGDNSKTLGEVIQEELKKDLESLDIEEEHYVGTKELIEFLKRDNVEVRVFDGNFLHGKAYIFEDRVVIGSSNFTYAGLTRPGELNTWKQESQAIYTRQEWFEKFWSKARDFKEELIKILEESRFGTKEYTPFQIYMKALYEYQKKELESILRENKDMSLLPESKVNLAEFQEVAVRRALTILDKYGACLIADSVGLGKTWIAKKIIEMVGYYKRKNILVVCPAQLREMWRKELKSIDVKENIISHDELAYEDYLDRARRVVGDKFNEIELIVVDESHNFRNPLSNRWENFFTLLEKITSESKNVKIVFMTATPINNSPWDLYWQLMLMFGQNDSIFFKENIPSLKEFFKKAEKDPTILSDVLNEISIRRTRDYIVKNYKEAYIIKNGKKQKIIFPERKLKEVNYELDKTYKGMYREISDIITNKLTMAYYKYLEYKRKKDMSDIWTLQRMIQIGGIFRTILLKRLESSVVAFRISVEKHIRFLETLLELIKRGKFIGKQTFSKLISKIDELSIEYIEKELQRIENSNSESIITEINAQEFDINKLIEDINKDIELMRLINNRVKTITPLEDAKLLKLKDILMKLSKSGQIVVFTYYADTLNYIYEEIKKDERFKNLRIEAISSSGKTSKDPKTREQIVERFVNGEIDILLSTDVLSEGQNLQTAKYLINYDLHWNPTRMIQRAGRIDRIGSPHKEIFIYNFFPENELEELLRLVQILQKKISDIDRSIGLDQSVLGEKIHPKVFGILKRIKEGDISVIEELEEEMYGGSDLFWEPLSRFLKKQTIEDLEKIPYGVHSGFKGNTIKGIFLYYKYNDDYHYWYFYDVGSGRLLTSKSEILKIIKCDEHTKRYVDKDLFNMVFGVSKTIQEDIKQTYTMMKEKSHQTTDHLIKDRSSKFIRDIIAWTDIKVKEHVKLYPNDEIWKQWKIVKSKLIGMKYTKKRLSHIRKIWKTYGKKGSGDWHSLIKEIYLYTKEKTEMSKEIIEEFDENKLKLAVIDFVS